MTMTPDTPSQRGEELDQAQQVQQAVSAQTLDLYLIEALLSSYLSDLMQQDAAGERALSEQIDGSAAFRQRALKAVHDGLVFSTYLGTFDDLGFQAALQELQALHDEALEVMRASVFDECAKVACQTLGGSTLSGLKKARCDLFRAAICNAAQA